MRRLLPVLALLISVAPGAHAAGTAYSTAAFTVTTNAHTFGQAPTFLPDGRIVVGQNLGTGDGQQIYTANLDGTDLRCLTCGQPAPNNVPVAQPGGRWILFHSWRGHYLTIGSPGFGGMGSGLYVIRPDGSDVTALTGTDPAHGSGEGEDNYHAYWSPDGKQIVWTHLNWNFVNNNGDGKFDVRVADFADDGVHPPRLDNVRVVRPANGHWYETQWWAPDGSGFLYTETWGSAMNLELFFCRLTANGCDSTRLTDDIAWDEQAIFTPDGNNVIFMSSRDHPGMFNTYSQIAKDVVIPPDLDYLAVLPIFEAGFEQPIAQESTDLYEIDLATGSVRRLTTDGDAGWVIPEFAWDPTNSLLIWTELRYPDGVRAPLPLDPATQLQQTASYLTGAPSPDPSTFTGGNINAILPLESRTRIGRFS